MRGNREFSGVIGIILASVLKVIQDSPTNFRSPGNVSAISPGQDEIYELIISHPSIVDSGRIVGNPHLTRGALAECIGTPQAIANRAIAST